MPFSPFDEPWNYVIGQFVCLLGITMAFALSVYGDHDPVTVRMTKMLFFVGMFGAVLFWVMLIAYLSCLPCMPTTTG